MNFNIFHNKFCNNIINLINIYIFIKTHFHFANQLHASLFRPGTKREEIEKSEDF